MQTWPSYHRSPSSSANSNNKIKENTGRDYPVLDHGTLEAAILVQRNGRFEWDSLVCSPSAKSRFCVAKSFKVFPATKPPPLPKPTTTINQRADHGAHFLRMQFPDVDVSADVIRSQIKEDSLQAAELAEFDPFEGNLLDIATGHDRTKYLVFPTGELGSELNLTPIFEGDNGKIMIKPTETPARTFSTPIQQITSSSSPAIGQDSQTDTLLGVRTFGATSLLKFDPEATTIGGVKDLTYFTSYELGGASIVDITICATAQPFDLLLMNKMGGIYGCSLAGGKKTMVKLYAGLDPSPKNPFWRVGRGENPTECTLLSANTLCQLDFRSNELVPLYTASAKDFLTSSENYSQDGLVRLCSTSQIVWIDPRFPGKPLYGCNHHRQFERTLRTSTLFFDGSPCTFLSSQRNGLLTVYNVSRHEDYLVRVDDAPYSVSTSEGLRRFTGQALLETQPRIVTIFRADQRAGVDCSQLQCTTEGYTDPFDSITLEESDAIKELREKAVNLKTDLDIFGDQEKVVKNLFPAYDKLFRIYAEQQEKVEEDQAEEFYDFMDRLPTFWQTSDSPSEHMLTSFDIAFRTQGDLNKSSRSDFTTGSLINSARGFRAVSQNKFPIDKLREGASWHLDITDIQNHIDSSLELNFDVRRLADSLRSYDLIKDDDRTALSIRRENNAREHLAVDLTLSKDVFSPSRFSPLREVGNDLETMTEALSLGENDTDEPPEVEFGYLTPVNKEKMTKEGHIHEEDEVSVNGRAALPMGVRLLLKDWEVGAKTKDYVFQDPYHTTGNLTSRLNVHPALSKFQQANTIPSLSQATNSQRPPTVMPSQALPSALGSASQPLPSAVRSQYPSIRSTFGTQIVRENVVGTLQPQASSSQQIDQFMVNTQVLPGPHGGRPWIPKKKKRLGGF